MKTCVKLLSYCHHISFALHTKYEAQSEDVREQEITELDERMRILRVRLTEKEKSRYIDINIRITYNLEL